MANSPLQSSSRAFNPTISKEARSWDQPATLHRHRSHDAALSFSAERQEAYRSAQDRKPSFHGVPLHLSPRSFYRDISPCARCSLRLRSYVFLDIYPTSSYYSTGSPAVASSLAHASTCHLLGCASCSENYPDISAPGLPRIAPLADPKVQYLRLSRRSTLCHHLYHRP